MRCLLSILFAALLSPPAIAATILHCGRVVEVRGGQIVTDTTIVVNGSTIQRVDKGFTAGTTDDRRKKGDRLLFWKLSWASAIS